jgi:protein PhnA
MSLKNFPDLQHFLATYFADTDAGAGAAADASNVQSFLASASSEKQGQVLTQAKTWNQNSASIVEDLGMETNRWFGDAAEAKEWIQKIAGLLETSSGGDSVQVKDSNGTVLSEGDSVTVIKDLKVKGGSSDLKRGTLIKKIRLIGDAGNIECNVDGSTLVLKTMFLKKS